MAKEKLLDEYKAAVTVGMSPDLLRWLTSYAPKSGDHRKLKIAKTEMNVVFFEEQELLSFNEWLRLPWPHKDGTRPGISTGIRREVKIEANGACALCQSHGDSCEAAHLDPVSKTECNHPEGLLWLCANHHTKYDNGRYGPDQENATFVKSLKTVLHRYKLMLWTMQEEGGRKLFLLLDECERLEKELASTKTEDQRKAIETLAEKALADLPNLAPVSRADPHYFAYKTISPQLSSLKAVTAKQPALLDRLKKAKAIKREYVAALGYVVCPLCNASGDYDGADCPICGGDREIEESIADRVDLAEYEKVRCPLCKGGETSDGDDCPECGGDGEMQRRFANYVDIDQFKKVQCPLCKSVGRDDGNDCPECGGAGEMPRYAADQVDIRQYDNGKCPLCKGMGRYAGNDCPECGGDCEMPRHAADKIDLDLYTKVKCPLCEGSGQFDGDDCPECGAEGEMTRGQADQVDLSQYKKVRCPLCEGREDDCLFCNGEGKVVRRAADDFDPHDYE